MFLLGGTGKTRTRTHFVNFKHNFHKEMETFFKNKLKWIQEICFKMNPLSSELPFYVHNWLIISLKDFCVVIRKWPTFWPSTSGYEIPQLVYRLVDLFNLTIECTPSHFIYSSVQTIVLIGNTWIV